MISHLLGSILDQKAQSQVQRPAFRVLIFSRWQDTDTAIVTGSYDQTPFDLTPYVMNGSLNLDSASDASTLSLQVAIEKFPIRAFYNSVIKLYEGDEQVDPNEWPNTFTGWHVGQPDASEEAVDGAPVVAAESRTERGNVRSASINYVSRDKQFTDHEITSNGVWVPNVKENPDALNFAYRDQFDDVGNIAREVGTDTSWGMGLDASEVRIGALPYRIEKQLQFVQVSPLKALQMLGQVLHLVPQFDGEGKLRFISRRLDDPPVREIDGSGFTALPMPAASFTEVNAVVALGLDKNLSEVLKPDQKLFSVDGTFGFFDSSVVTDGAWGGDEQESYRIKVGTLPDGNGVTATSPRISNFSNKGFIDTVNPPKFIRQNEFNYAIEISNDTQKVLSLMLLIFSAYTGAVLLGGTFRDTHVHPIPGGPPAVPSVGWELLAGGILVAGLTVLQQIGNYSYDVYGVPYETVYQELRAEAILEQFGTRFAGQPFREYERRDIEVKNYIFSSIEDNDVPAGPATQLATTNPGLKTWAERELAIQLCERMSRSMAFRRDILLEPGDVLSDKETGQRYKVKSISREIRRGASPTMDLSIYRVK